MFKSQIYHANSMIEYFIAACLMLLTLGHALLIKHCYAWGRERQVTYAMLDERLGSLSTLIDEGLDLAVDVAPTSAQQVPMDLKESLAQILISRFVDTQSHGDTQRQERTVQENEQTQNEQVQGSGIDSPDISDSS